MIAGQLYSGSRPDPGSRHLLYPDAGAAEWRVGIGRAVLPPIASFFPGCRDCCGCTASVFCKMDDQIGRLFPRATERRCGFRPSAQLCQDFGGGIMHGPFGIHARPSPVLRSPASPKLPGDSAPPPAKIHIVPRACRSAVRRSGWQHSGKPHPFSRPVPGLTHRHPSPASAFRSPVCRARLVSMARVSGGQKTKSSVGPESWREICRADPVILGGMDGTDLGADPAEVVVEAGHRTGRGRLPAWPGLEPTGDCGGITFTPQSSPLIYPAAQDLPVAAVTLAPAPHRW